MTIPAHLITGLIVGKITGNYPLAIGVSLLLDVDHLFTYFKHGELRSFKKFWKTATEEHDPYGDQRNWLHSVFTLIGLTAVIAIFNQDWALTFGFAYLGHLIIDLLDSSEFNPFYPLKFSIKGPVKYFSKYEVIFTLVLLVIYFLI